jgi:hypothetical protein
VGHFTRLFENINGVGIEIFMSKQSEPYDQKKMLASMMTDSDVNIGKATVANHDSLAVGGALGINVPRGMAAEIDYDHLGGLTRFLSAGALHLSPKPEPKDPQTHAPQPAKRQPPGGIPPISLVNRMAKARAGATLDETVDESPMSSHAVDFMSHMLPKSREQAGVVDGDTEVASPELNRTKMVKVNAKDASHTNLPPVVTHMPKANKGILAKLKKTKKGKGSSSIW